MSKHRARGQKSRGGSGRLEERLVQEMGLWASGKLHLKENSVPATEELKLLLKDTSSISMWDHIVTCVHSPGDADTAKKNLQLYIGDHGNERAELCARRLEFGREVNSLELAVSQMEMEVARLKTDIRTLAGGNEVMEGEISEGHRRRALLAAARIKSHEEAGLLEEYTKRVVRRKNCFSCSNLEESYFTRTGGVKDAGGVLPDGSNIVLESACKRDVREACEVVKGLLSSLTLETSTEDVGRAKTQLWSKVESLLSTHPPAWLVQCLCELAQDEASTLRASTASLDLASDAAQLRCPLDQSGGESSKEQQGSLLQSVEDHLLEAQLSHINRCVECKRSQDAARLILTELDKVKSEVEELLWKQIPSADQTKKELMRAVLFQQFEESGCESMLERLCLLCAGLESAKTQRMETLAGLRIKRDQIDQFSRITENKHSLIRRLAKLNSNGREKIQRQRSELELYVKKNVCGHESQLLAVGAGLHGMGGVQLELLSALDLDRATMTPGLSTPTCQLSVHRLAPRQPSGLPGWEGLLAAVQLPLHASPQALLAHVMSSLDRVESLSKELASQKDLILRVKHSSVDVHDSQSVLQASRDYDNQLRDKGVDEIAKSLLLASRALAHCSLVQKTLQEWWVEPSQNCVPWISHDGMPLSKWLEQWRVLTAKLRQLSA